MFILEDHYWVYYWGLLLGLIIGAYYTRGYCGTYCEALSVGGCFNGATSAAKLAG